MSLSDYCCAFKCLNNKMNNDLMFFKFPTDPEQCREWVQRVCRVGFNPQSSSLCQIHFDKDSFVDLSCTALKDFALPTRRSRVGYVEKEFISMRSPGSSPSFQLTGYCRICSKPGKDLLSIYDEVNLYLEKILKDHMNIQISQTDVLPLTVCTACSHVLSAYWKLFDSYQEVEQILFSLLTHKTVSNNSKMSGPVLRQTDNKQKISWPLTIPKHNPNLEKPASKKATGSNVPIHTHVEIKGEESLPEVPTSGNGLGSSSVIPKKRFDPRLGTRVVSPFKNKVDGFEVSIPVMTDVYISDRSAKDCSLAECHRCKLYFVSADLASHMLECVEKDNASTDIKPTGQKKKKKWEIDTQAILSAMNEASKSKRKLVNEVQLDDPDNAGVKFVIQDKIKERCTACGSVFKSALRLAVHKKSYCDKLERPCLDCGKIVLSGKYNMEKHRKIAHRKGKYFCDICGKEFPVESRLKIHRRSHDNPGVNCEICGRSFKIEQNLVVHLFTEHDIKKNDRIFNCDVCDKVFTNPDKVEWHMKRHKLDMEGCKRKLVCDKCELIFDTKNTFIGHVKKGCNGEPIIKNPKKKRN